MFRALLNFVLIVDMIKCQQALIRSGQALRDSPKVFSRSARGEATASLLALLTNTSFGDNGSAR